MKTKEEILEELIEINYFLLKAASESNKKDILKWKLMLDNLIKLILKD